MTQQEVSVRLRTATGCSTAEDAADAGREAAREAIAALEGRPPAMIIVYATVRYNLKELLAAVRSVTGDTPLVGESSAGQMHGGELMAPGAGVTVMAMTAGPYRFGFACAEGVAARGEAAGRDLARAARADLGPDVPPYATLMIFTDGLFGNQQSLVTGLHHVAGAAVPVVGGAAADDRQLNETYVFIGDRVLRDAAVAVWIGSGRPVSVAVGHGWHPVGLPLLVTRTDELIVEEIGGQPAGAVFAERISRAPNGCVDCGPERAEGYYAGHAFGLIEPDGTHLVRAVYLADDGIHTFAPLPPYSAVQIMGGNPQDLLDMSQEVARRALSGREASVLLVFSCVARMDILGDRAAEEAAVLQKTAGPVPTFGLYTYGEFARTTSVAGYHNATVAAIAL